MPALLQTLLAALVGGLLVCGAASAQYPDRPISMIVAFPAGGSTDVTGRILATFIEKHLGNNARVVVLNRPGAGGQVGFEAIAQAAPDGYTIGFLNTPSIVTIPIERKVRFTWRDYDLLGNILDDPGAFSVHRDHQVATLADLAAYAKAHPGEVTVGTSGVGSDDHLAMLAFERIAQVKMTHVPYNGAGATRTGLEGRHIVLGAINIGEAKSFAESGSPFRILGQMSKTRTDVAPEVPTFREQGYDIELASLRGVAAPRGLPDAIRDRLVRAVAAAAEDPEFKAKMKSSYSPLRFLPPREYAATLEQAEAEFAAIWKETPWSGHR